MITRTTLVYGAIAGLCLGLHNATMIVADHFGAPLWLAVVLSFVLVALTGYVLHSLGTFRQPLGLIGLMRYSLAMSANIPLAYGTTWLWLKLAGLPMLWASPLASLCMLAINFLLSRWAIVGKGQPRNQPFPDGEM